MYNALAVAELHADLRRPEFLKICATNELCGRHKLAADARAVQVLQCTLSNVQLGFHTVR
jgi:hypothetical protein